jgi:radical SAM superfamily enzyme YgiQ (UPF0313 family)
LTYASEKGIRLTEKSDEGYKIVLTADRTLMSEYNGGVFLGFSACVPHGLLPDKLYFSLFCPSVEVNKDGSVKYAPCGTRKMEAMLLDHGFSRDDIIVAHPDYLNRVVGPRTKVIGITENDPLGIGPATSTFTQLFGGEAYMALKFKEILQNPAVKRYKPCVIVGGPGAWQLEPEGIRRDLGIDCVVIGEGERVAASLFDKAVNGESLPELVYGDVVPVEEIPTIKGPTVDGIIEIARGCGRGCAFCVPTLQRYRCLPLEHILKEVEVNMRAGRRPLLHAEDVLRYKANGIEVNKQAVVELFKAVKSYPGVDTVGISHFALSSVASAPELIEELSKLLEVGKNGEWMSGQTGIETGSPDLIKKYMNGKCKPFTPEDWPNVVIDAFEVLSKNNWVPVSTLIIGLPGETEKDVELTINLIEKLKPFKSLIVPLFFVAEGGMKNRTESFTVHELTRSRSELFLKCWDHNLNWGETLLREYIVTMNGSKGFGIRFIFSYGIKQSRELIRRCREEYNYDIQAMIKDAKNGNLKTTSFPIRVVYKLVKPITGLIPG